MSEEKPEMRPLDAEEQQIIKTRLISTKQELDEMLFVKHQAELMLSEGIAVDVEVQRREYNKRLKAAENKMKEINFTIEVCEKQLKDGVKVAPPTQLPKTITVSVPEEKNYYEIVDKLEDMGLIVNKPEVEENED
ncbi:MAG: hypothetical protein WC444_06920 [Candidatus Paceibacterota bacterium]